MTFSRVLCLAILSCSPSGIMLPNEYQYDICNKAVECEMMTDASLDKCVACVDAFISEHPDFTAKMLRDTVVGDVCPVMIVYADISGIAACVNK